MLSGSRYCYPNCTDWDCDGSRGLVVEIREGFCNCFCPERTSLGCFRTPSLQKVLFQGRKACYNMTLFGPLGSLRSDE